MRTPQEAYRCAAEWAITMRDSGPTLRDLSGKNCAERGRTGNRFAPDHHGPHGLTLRQLAVTSVTLTTEPAAGTAPERLAMSTQPLLRST